MNEFAPILGQLLGKVALDLLSNPQTLETLANQFAPCHTAADVAQDALDAWENGKLSAEACRKIVEAVLEDRAARARPVRPPKSSADLAAALEELYRN